jgi:phospholipase/lecithinase/hemolysin
MQHVNENNRLGDGTKTVPSGTLNDYVIAIIETASKNQCHCVNLYRNKLLNPNIAAYGKKYFYEDLEHPTAAGHKLIAQDIIDNVLKIKE